MGCKAREIEEVAGGRGSTAKDTQERGSLKEGHLLVKKRKMQFKIYYLSIRISHSFKF
jgi:hypothetical protein